MEGIEKNVFEEIIAEEFPILMKSNTPQIQEARQIPSTRNRNKTTPRHIVIKT